MFARAFDDASEQVLFRFFDLLWKVKRFLNISSEATMKQSIRTINDFVYSIIDRKIEQMSREQHEFVSSIDILLAASLNFQEPGLWTVHISDYDLVTL